MTSNQLKCSAFLIRIISQLNIKRYKKPHCDDSALTSVVAVDTDDCNVHVGIYRSGLNTLIALSGVFSLSVIFIISHIAFQCFVVDADLQISCS